MRALAKDRKQRPTNALEFSQELTAAYAQVNTLSASATEPLRQAVQTPVSNPQVTAPVAASIAASVSAARLDLAPQRSPVHSGRLDNDRSLSL